jgi:hypothetical protein
VIVPCTVRDANAFVARTHRHHGPVLGARFALGCGDRRGLHGVAIVGRPVARGLDDGLTVEVTRLATDGTPNACSMLYAASWRAACAIGYRRIVTYTLASEPGTSLRAAGWQLVARVRGRSWDCRARPRKDKHPIEAKCRWQRLAA